MTLYGRHTSKGQSHRYWLPPIRGWTCRTWCHESYGDLAPLGKQLARLRFEDLDLSGVRPWGNLSG
jgi:hypothetical protein